MTLRFRVAKLIRDGMPARMRAMGLRVHERTLEPDEYVVALQEKLVEEATEARAATRDAELLEELADVAEVLWALAASRGFAREDVEAKRLAKRAERGGFDARVFNSGVEADEGTPATAYYLAQPDRYPRE